MRYICISSQQLQRQDRLDMTAAAEYYDGTALTEVLMLNHAAAYLLDIY